MPAPGQELKPFALCLPGDVKALVDSGMGAEYDGLITLLINGFSALAQGRAVCNRNFEHKQYTETFDGGTRSVILAAPPVDSGEIVEVREDEDRAFGDGTVLTQYEDYSINFEAAIINRLYARFPAYPQCVRVIYTGGLFNTSESGGTDAPDDLRMACAMQVSYWFKNRTDLALESVSISQIGSARIFQPTEILPAVRRVLLGYRRQD